MIKKGLGKGLGALFAVYEEDEKEIENIKEYEENTNVAQTESKENVGELDINKVIRNLGQPRKYFDEASLQELAESIKVHGIIQPIIVAPQGDKYVIIAGERRYRASKLAGIKTIPAIIKNYTDRQIKEIAIIENLQRENLNPIETARAIKEIMVEYKLTQDEVADRLGKSRSNIANVVRLLTLPQEVITLVEQDKLSAGHARCLITIDDKNKQAALAQTAVTKALSVRELEVLAKQSGAPQSKKAKLKQAISMELKDLIDNIERIFSTKASVIGNDNKGRISIDYFTRDDLNRICELMDELKAIKKNK